ALALMNHSGLIPQLLQLSHQPFRLRWIPATIDASVQQLTDLFITSWPKGLRVLQHTEEKTAFLSVEDQFFFLISLMVEQAIAQISSPANSVEAFFFKEFVFDPEQERDSESPAAIQRWLQRFFLGNRRFNVLLKVEELENDDTAFELSLWINDKESPLEEPLPFQSIFESKQLTKPQLALLQDLAMLEEYLPAIKTFVNSKGKRNVVLNADKFLEVFLNGIPILELVGVKILLPKSLRKIFRPQPSLELSSFENENSAKGYLQLAEMLDFQWQVAIGDQLMPAAEFWQQVEGASGLVKLQDSYVLIDEKEMQALVKHFQKPPTLGSGELLQAALSEEYEGAPIQLTAETEKIIQNLLAQESVPPPETLQATLRPYQHRGYNWLYKNDRIGFGSILADDMGLGKTLQVISLLAQLHADGELASEKALIVAPTTLLSNWEREVQKFAPHLQVCTYHGPQRELILDGHDLILTSYGIARSDQRKLSKISWRVLVIDEAQAIKNPAAAQTKALKKFQAKTRVAMSGTPVENRLSEYWSLFDFINKGYLKGLKKFKSEFIKPIEGERDHEKLATFLSITSPFILRRLKTDKSIISDLPEKITQDQICQLTKEQTVLYQGVVQNNLKAIEENEGIARAGMIFKLMTALKQICNHPAQYLKQENAEPGLSGKVEQLLLLLDNIREQGEKVLIFTQYRSMGELLQQLISERYPEDPLLLHGGHQRKKRDQLVETFQTKSYAWAFVLSIKAAGTGLNLTAANHVIHFDLWWNPAVEAQATDRAFRIGQTKTVMVHRLITKGTFEEKINEMIQGKKELADLTVSTGEKWIGDLSNRELEDIFQL
ncbi:MAG: DEAD/DEAH box helicase, partial [Bacteroidota bacterium]